MKLDSGNVNTQIKQRVANAIQDQQPNDTILPLAALLGGKSFETADVVIGIVVQQLSFDQNPSERNRNGGVSDAKSSKMLIEICRDHSHLQNIRFPTIREISLEILIGTDAFTTTVRRQFRTGSTGTTYGVNLVLGWTLTG